VRHRVVFGTLEAGHQGLTVCGWHINTAFVERLNLHLRQHGAAIGRRVTTLGKHAGGVRQQLVWYQVYSHFCVPHTSVRQPWPELQRPTGTGAAKQWQSWPPALAAGLTDRVWTRREALRLRVPPWPQSAGV